MKKYILLFPSALLLFSCGNKNSKSAGLFSYPETKKVDSSDNYFGTVIQDPYRWLEDDNSPETAEWVKKQNQLTFDYLSKIPMRNQIKDRLTQVWNFEKVSSPSKKGKYFFYFKNNGIQNQSVLYVQEGINGTPRVLIDPNKLSEDGTVSLSTISVSDNAKFLAYGVSKAGSDWTQIQVINIETGELQRDNIDWVKFSGVSWVEDDGFYYSSYDKPEEGKELSKKNEYHKVYYHFIGDEQDKDILVYEDKKNPLRNFHAHMTDEGRYLIVNGSESTSGNSLIVKDVVSTNPVFITIVDNFENDHSVVDNIGEKILMVTNLNAPKYRLVLVDPAKPQPENWKNILPESEDLLENISLLGNKIVATYQHDVTSKVSVYTLEGVKEGDITLPGMGSVAGFNSEITDTIAFYTFNTFISPGTIYKYNIINNTSTVFVQPKCEFKSDEYETKQVFYTSKDGTKIPMYITSKKGIKLDGNNPVFLYGYGGFNISVKPSFAIDKAVFLENGGIYAVANLRGGGEYGEDWHKAGTLCNKQNVFDDFIAAAEYLVKEKYTSHDKIAIHGRSNGGLLIGAVMTQRPDIAKVALPAVGVLDMLRYHKFTIGWAWATDYGKSDNKEHFDCLIKYSPLHNVKEVAYPATMVMTADHDDRVVPAHSFKFAATLQEKHKGEAPVLIRIDTKAGHGAGKPVAKQIEEFADLWAFVFHNLGMSLGAAPAL